MYPILFPQILLWHLDFATIMVDNLWLLPYSNGRNQNEDKGVRIAFKSSTDLAEAVLIVLQNHGTQLIIADHAAKINVGAFALSYLVPLLLSSELTKRSLRTQSLAFLELLETYIAVYYCVDRNIRVLIGMDQAINVDF